MRLVVLTAAVFVCVALRPTLDSEGRSLSVKADCTTYDPGSVQISDEGDVGWTVADKKNHVLLGLLDTEEDAQSALAVAKANTAQCFIGRSNKRPNRKDYIFVYWK